MITRSGIDDFTPITNLLNMPDRKRSTVKPFRKKRWKTLDNLLEGCQIIGYDWCYLYVNDAIVGYSHRNKEDFLAHTVMEVYPGIEETELFMRLRDCMDRRTPFRMETLFAFGSDSQRWFDISGKPIPEGILILSLDINERTREGKTLKIIAENSPVGMFVIQDGKLQFSNRQFWEDTLYTEDELLGMDLMKLILPEDRDLVRANTIRMLKGQSRQPFECRILRKNGEVRLVLETVTSVHFGGRPATLGNYLDITELKRTQDELLKYQKHLEELVEIRTALANETAKQLEQEIAKHIEMRLQKEYLYEKERKLREELQKQINRRIATTRAIIHELKTPLTPMLGASEILMGKTKDKSLHRLAVNINRGTINLKNRITDLTDITKGEIGILQLRYSWIDVSHMLREISDYVIPAAKTKGQRLILKLPDSLPKVKADEERLQQVIMNLLNNALRFSSTNGEITLEAQVNSGGLTISVADNGPGISEKDQSSIFEPYFTLDTQKNTFDGLGIGLPLCKMLVQLHGGKIWVNSQKGLGTKFSFSIPIENIDIHV